MHTHTRIYAQHNTKSYCGSSYFHYLFKGRLLLKMTVQGKGKEIFLDWFSLLAFHPYSLRSSVGSEGIVRPEQALREGEQPNNFVTKLFHLENAPSRSKSWRMSTIIFQPLSRVQAEARLS